MIIGNMGRMIPKASAAVMLALVLIEPTVAAFNVPSEAETQKFVQACPNCWRRRSRQVASQRAKPAIKRTNAIIAIRRGIDDSPAETTVGIIYTCFS